MAVLKYKEGAVWKELMGVPGTVYDTDQIGTIKAFSGKTVPDNWRLAAGQSLDRVAYKQLYDVIGTAYGAVDSAHFNLPDLTGRFVYGANAALSDVGLKGGSAAESLTVDQLPAHSHQTDMFSFQTNYGTQTTVYSMATPNTQPGTMTSRNNGLGYTHNNLPPYLLVAQIIKVTGVQIDSGGALVGPQGPPGNSATIPIEAWHVVGAAGEPAYQNGWGPHGAGVYQARFRKRPDGMVELDGMVRGGTLGQPAFTLPVGYRPQIPESFGSGALYISVLVGLNKPANITISAGGTVSPEGTIAVGDYVSLAGIQFSTSQADFPTGPKGDKGDPGNPTASVPMENWITVNPTGGAAPAFLSGYSTAYGVPDAARFRKDPLGRVYMAGSIVGPTNGGIAFYLPAGYRPPSGSYRRCAVAAVTAAGGVQSLSRVVINGTDGAVSCDALNSPNLWHLTDIVFDTETVTQMPAGPKGDKGDKGDPGIVSGVPSTEAWITPTLLSGSHYAAPYGPVQYRKRWDGTVELRGLWTVPGTGSLVIFNLPAAYRPTSTSILIFTGATSAVGLPDIRVGGSDGNVVMSNSPASGWVSLSEVRFSVD